MSGCVGVGFVQTTFDMISDPDNYNIVAWDDIGDSVVIIDECQLSRVLQTHFKHSNLSSFVRQLNLYGFRRRRNTLKKIFYHPFFRRGRPGPLVNIIRHKTKAESNVVDQVVEQILVLKRQYKDLVQTQVQEFRRITAYLQTD